MINRGAGLLAPGPGMPVGAGAGSRRAGESR